MKVHSHEVVVMDPKSVWDVIRLRVPGGWLYEWRDHVTFVPEPEKNNNG